MHPKMLPRGSTPVATSVLIALAWMPACSDFEAAPTGESDGSGSTSDGAVDPTTSVSAGFDSESGAAGEGEGDGGPSCDHNEDCGVATPFCVAGECLGCNALADPAAACESLEADTPLCAGGPCVQCDEDNADACVEDTPVCGEDNVCSACTAHDQCMGACALDTGHCIDTILFVDGDDQGGNGFAKIGLALASVPEGERAAIVVTATEACYLENLEVDGERSIALLGRDGSPACLSSVEDQPVIAVGAGSALYVQDFRIEGAWGVGIAARGAPVFVDRAAIVSNQGGALTVSQGSKLRAYNSILGGDRNNVPAVEIDASDADIVYSTIAGGFGSAMALRCSGDGLHRVRNSIVVAESAGGEVDCPDAVIENSALESAFGMGNRAVGPVDTANWFVDFAGGDLHLNAEIPETLFGAVAIWEPGDPSTDIDGDPRPTTAEAPDWCGADIP